MIKQKSNNTGQWIIPAIALWMALLTLKAFFPGFMSPDSFGYLDQGKTGIYDDMHSPGMSIVWGFLFSLWDNVGSLFVFHTFLYWASWSALALTVSHSWKSQLLILLTAALPPLWSQITVVWTDSEFSLFLVDIYLLGLWASLAGQAKKNSHHSPRIVFTSLALALFLFSSLVRANALPALLPLSYFLSRILFPKLSAFRGSALAVILCVLGLSVSLLVPREILHSKKSYPYQLLLTYDIAGVFVRTGDGGVIPEYWSRANRLFTPELLLKAYTPLTEVPLSFQDDSPVFLTRVPDSLEELRQKWRRALHDHPGEFLAHRWAVFKRLMGIGEDSVFDALYFETADNLVGIRNQGDPGLQDGIKSYFRFFRDSLFFRGWFYLCGLGVLFVILWRGRRNDPIWLAAVCSCLSGLLYGIGYIAYPPSAEFRFLYPMAALFFMSLILTAGGSRGFSSRPIRGKKRQ